MAEGKTTIVKNARIVRPDTIFNANILIKNGKIAAITAQHESVECDEVIDAGGRYVIPGAVDGHTHMMDPGHTEREDFITGTRAAAYGGVTTVITHHRTIPPVYTVKELREKIRYLKDRSVVDFGLKGGGAPDNIQELKAMWDEGVTGFKMFTCNMHGAPAMYPGDLLKAFREIASWDGTVLIHCEDDHITSTEEQRLKKEGRKDYLSHSEWRSSLAERLAVETVIEIAMETGVRVVIAHVSQPVLLEKIKTARDRGYPVYAEMCPYYLYLTLEDLKERGPWVKFTPPMRARKAEELDIMWEMLTGGFVSVLGSDHCPYPKEQKKAGDQNIWDAPNGLPGVETSMRLMLNGVNNGKTTINKVVEVMCENPARVYGLYPKKGTMEIGSDADLVILDMEREEMLTNSKILSKCGWTPYDGMKIKGVADTVLLRGEVVVKEGKVLSQPGFGKFQPRLDKELKV